MRKFWLDAVIATLFVFLFMWGIFKITQLNMFNAFDSIGKALEDVELTDYVFSAGIRDDPTVDEDIVIVNIGRLTRGQVAEQIKILSKYKPKVIGIDSFFDCETGLRDTVNCPQLRDSVGNAHLSQAIREAGNVVLVSKLLQSWKVQVDSVGKYPPNTFDSLELSDPQFTDYALATGYANLDTEAAFQDDVKACRSFNPSMDATWGKELAFSVRTAMVFDSVKTKRFLERNNFSEIINYRGNIVDFFHQTKYPQMFYTLDISDVVTENFVPEMIKDKVIILGFLGEELGDPSWSDKFYTPLNKKLAGKANPDMFGVVVHANAVSMILHEDYVDAMKGWQMYALAFIVCVLNVALFSLIHTRFPLWYDGITKLLQLIQLLLYTVLMVLIFHWYQFKLNITITLAAVALVGDAYEIYMSVIKNLLYKAKNWILITKPKEEVLTP
jgi:CHASE2 domain-containing sensor protein